MAPQILASLEAGTTELREAARDIRDREKAVAQEADEKAYATLNQLDPVGAEQVRESRLRAQ